MTPRTHKTLQHLLFLTKLALRSSTQHEAGAAALTAYVDNLPDLTLNELTHLFGNEWQMLSVEGLRRLVVRELDKHNARLKGTA